MDIFITGATGFVGKQLLELIAADNRFQKIYCLHRKECETSSRINLVSGSLEDLRNIPPVKADVCIHLAAITNSSVANNTDIFNTNAEGTAQVIEFCRKSNISKIVFLSSVNVYLKKKYSYALSKILAEEHIKSSDLKYSILRCSLVYGNGCQSFEKIVKFAKKFHVVPVLGAGKSYKQPIYIDEVCHEIIKHTFLMEQNIICDLYGKTKMTYNEMVKALISANRERAFLLHLPIKPFIFFSEIFYNLGIPFPIHPEQISHMCEDLYYENPQKDFYDAYLDEFYDNLCKYTH